MRGPFPDVRFVATGGIDLPNAGALLDCRAPPRCRSAAAFAEQLPQALATLVGRARR